MVDIQSKPVRIEHNEVKISDEVKNSNEEDKETEDQNQGH
jgi:hypothetical protein